MRFYFSKFEKKIFALNDFLYKNPELGYEEVKSHKEITKLISNLEKSPNNSLVNIFNLYQRMLIPEWHIL